MNRRQFLSTTATAIGMAALHSSTNADAQDRGIIRKTGAFTMIQLHIYLDVAPGKEQAIEEAYRKAYVPAIIVQEGYVSTALLKSSSGMRRYQIDIAFETEEKRLKWVASKEHQTAWPKVDALCHTISWQGFDVIA